MTDSQTAVASLPSPLPSGVSPVKKIVGSDPALPTGSSGKSADKYFRKKTAIHLRSIPAVLDALDRAWMNVRRNTNLLLPDQNIQSKEVFVATLFVWVHNMIESKGIREYERLMREPFEEMRGLIEQDLKSRPHEGDKPGPRAQFPNVEEVTDPGTDQSPRRAGKSSRKKPPAE